MSLSRANSEATSLTHAPSPVRSKYNYFARRDERWIGYNARLGSIAVLADDVVRALQGNGPLSVVRGTDELLRLGFLHLGDELDQILDIYNAAKNHTTLHLTITPTLGC